MSHTSKGKPFILRSEVTETTVDDAARRTTILSELTDADLDRVSGGTNTHPDIKPDWSPQTGADHTTTTDGGSGGGPNEN